VGAKGEYVVHSGGHEGCARRPQTRGEPTNGVPSAVVVKGGSHASPILLDSQVCSDCGSIRKQVRFAEICD